MKTAKGGFAAMRSGRSFKSPARQPWLIIFSDMMTLMLTFFIILASMSVVNDKNSIQAVESVRTVFGRAARELAHNPLVGGGAERAESGTEHSRQSRPGRGDTALTGNSRLLFDDNPDIHVRYAEDEIVIAIPENLLFTEGSVEILPEGRQSLNRLLPYFHAMLHPASIRGYSATGLGEGLRSQINNERVVDPSWSLSLERALSVYKYFGAMGVNTSLLLLEAYGSHRPRFSNDTPEGRFKNRRIELILDKRNPGLLNRMDALSPEPARGQEYYFRDFRFDLDLPGEDRPGAREGGD
ncbi:MAG: OmpA family protein [Deltaproteobacteria bacterium]|jgi:chemotaxis protein MotB|nr:OmpA family protein [Deltaproteobacteria bacterium]